MPVADAQQLFLLLYCTLDVLPREMRSGPLGRKELSQTVSKLAADGLLQPGADEEGRKTYQPMGDISDENAREKLIDDLLLQRIELDWDFIAKATRFV